MTTARRSPRPGSLAASITLLLFLIEAPAALAHRRDEYLQAARIAIDADRIRLFIDLTPGIAVAERVLSDIDLDRDGFLSGAEGRAYAGRLLRGIHAEVDGIPLAFELADSSVPAVEAVRNGEGAIRLGATARLPDMRDGAHRLVYRNSFDRDIGVYLANALVPEDHRVAVTAQRRDVDQRELTIEYTFESGAARSSGMIALGAIGVFAASALLLRRRRRIVTTL